VLVLLVGLGSELMGAMATRFASETVTAVAVVLSLPWVVEAVVAATVAPSDIVVTVVEEVADEAVKAAIEEKVPREANEGCLIVEVEVEVF
jgi:hypothetical protein